MRRRNFIALLGMAAAACPLAVRAQEPAMPVIGFLGGSGFRQALAEAGYVERQNVAIEYLWAEGQYDRLPAIAAEPGGRRGTLLRAGDGPSAPAAKGGPPNIPPRLVHR